jgi:hypothetical protein
MKIGLPRAVMEEIDFGEIERSIANLLAQRFGCWVSTAALIDAAYGLQPAGGPLDAANVVKAHVHAIRVKIAPYGLAVEGKAMIGRRMVRLAA